MCWGGRVERPAEGEGCARWDGGSSAPNPHDFLLPRPPSPPSPHLPCLSPHTRAHTTCRWPRVRMKQRIVKEGVKYIVHVGYKTDSLAMSLTGLWTYSCCGSWWCNGDVSGRFVGGEDLGEGPSEEEGRVGHLMMVQGKHGLTRACWASLNRQTQSKCAGNAPFQEERPGGISYLNLTNIDYFNSMRSHRHFKWN